MPDQAQIEALAERHYAHFLRAGAEGLNPLVTLTAPAQGKVLWWLTPTSPPRQAWRPLRRLSVDASRQQDCYALEGYEVSTLDWATIFPEQRREFEGIGFDESSMRDGIWVLQGKRYEFQPAGPGPRSVAEQPGSTTHRFAHYDAMTGSWQVTGLKPGAGWDGEWVEQWEPSSLSDLEKNVISRIAEETGVLLDVAVTLRDDAQGYWELEYSLLQKTQKSADSWDRRYMNAILWPPFQDLNRRLPLGIPFDLRSRAEPLYRALAGRAQRDSTGDMAVATVSEATLCPPYEKRDSGLSRPASGAESSRPQAVSGRERRLSRGRSKLFPIAGQHRG